MRIQQAFEVPETRDRVWEFFGAPERVAECFPGVESTEVIDEDNLRVHLTQSVGPMTATFVLKMTITERVDNEALAFTAVGRVVRGASGSVRATNRVQLDDAGDSSTRIGIDAEVAMGGMLGSVGQKVIAKQAEQVTEQFATRLQRALNGEPLEPEEERKGAPQAAGERADGLALPKADLGGISIDLSDRRVVLAWLAGRSAGSKAVYARLVKKGYLT